MSEEPYRVTFVCTGNICRSPMAEWIFRHHVAEEGLNAEVDSSGIDAWHEGEEADRRTMQALHRAGYLASGSRARHSARRFEPRWFDEYDLIIALDGGHLRELRAMAPDETARDKVRMLREFDPEAGDDLDVPDPYYGADDDFEHVLELVEAAVPGLLDEVRTSLKDR